MKRIDFWLVCKNLFKRGWIILLCGMFGAGGAFFLVKEQAPQWQLSAQYKLELAAQGKSESTYEWEVQAARAACNLLGQRWYLELEQPALAARSGYTLSAVERYVRVDITADSEETLHQINGEVEESLRAVIQKEFGAEPQIALVAEPETGMIATSGRMQNIALGALLGVCIALCGLLIAEYVKSPQE